MSFNMLNFYLNRLILSSGFNAILGCSLIEHVLWKVFWSKKTPPNYLKLLQNLISLANFWTEKNLILSTTKFMLQSFSLLLWACQKSDKFWSPLGINLKLDLCCQIFYSNPFYLYSPFTFSRFSSCYISLFDFLKISLDFRQFEWTLNFSSETVRIWRR